MSQFDAHRRPIPGTEFDVDCDTLLLSVGLIPENELSRHAGVRLDPTTCGASVDDRYMTNVDGIFSCGNVLHIHDLADWAAEEGERAGRSAAVYSQGAAASDDPRIRIEPGDGVRYVVPQTAAKNADEILVSFRVTEPGESRIAEVIAGGRALVAKTLRRAHPAEMVQMRVVCTDGLDVDQLEVRVR